VVDGVDDDCIAIGYNGTGFATNGIVANNYLKARNDLGTSTGRGIWVGKAQDVLIANNNIDTIKQTGIFINDDGTGVRPLRISVKNNKIRNVATSSGHGIAVYKADYVTLEGNTVENQASGSCIEIADWTYLTIKGGVLTQAVNTFARAIHADESAIWGATWTDLRISDVAIRMLGASTNNGVYLSPDASVTMAGGSVTGITCSQVVAGDYIYANTARQSGTWKVGNNTTLTAGRTVTSGGTLFNNN
jgi:parallel beta-helix repeat protein